MTESVGGPSAGSLRQAEIILHDQKEFHRRWGLATRKPGGAKATHGPGHRNIPGSRPRFRTCTGNTSWTRRCTPSTQCCPIRASASAHRARSHGGWMHASMPAAAAIPSAKRFVRGPDVRIRSACRMALAPIDKPSSTGAATGNTTAASSCCRRAGPLRACRHGPQPAAACPCRKHPGRFVFKPPRPARARRETYRNVCGRCRRIVDRDRSVRPRAVCGGMGQLCEKSQRAAVASPRIRRPACDPAQRSRSGGWREAAE